MNWETLSKEQKQALVLISMWVVGGLFALWHFVLSPFFRTSGQSTSELEDLQGQIQKAEVAMEGESKLRAEYAVSTTQIKASLEKNIVPTENPLSWATEKIYKLARDAGVDIQSVGEMGSSSPAWENLVKGDRVFKPYGVRIVAQASYAQLTELIRKLEESNPYLCVTGIMITSQDQNVNKHMINLVVEWPMWGRELKVGEPQPVAAGT